jgi:transcription elongation factor S-II
MKIINADLFRESIRQEFGKFIKGKDILINLEKGIFNSTIKEAKGKKIVRKWDNNNFVNLYLNKYRSVWANINKDSHVHNEDLINKVNLGEIPAYKIAFMNSREMYPEKWKILVDEKIKRDNNMYTENIASATDEFKCYKCTKRQCTYYQLQTRSADEAMTTFITCLNCGNNWKC